MTTLTRVRGRHAVHLPVEGPRKIVSAVLVLMGAAILVLTVVNNLFKVGPSFERLTDGFRPHMTSSAIATTRTDVAGLGAAGTEIQTALLPAMAQQLGMTPAQFSAYVAQTFPQVSAGLTQLPQIVTTFDGLTTTLDQQRPFFRSADAIPTKGLPATSVPWAFAGAGVLLIGCGVLVLLRPRPGAAAAVGLGALLLVAPLVMSMPQKAADADTMNSNLKPVYTAQLVTQAKGALTTVSAMGTQMQTQMLPALAAQLHMTPAAVQQMLATQFPATAKALAGLPSAMPRFQATVNTFDANLDEYGTLKPVELRPLVLVLMGVAALTLLLGAATLLWPRHEEVTLS